MSVLMLFFILLLLIGVTVFKNKKAQLTQREARDSLGI